MPKVLHLRSTGAFLGAESVVLELAAHLPEFKFGAAVGVIRDSRDPYPELAERAEKKGLTTAVFDADKRIDAECVARIKQYVVDYKPDIIHCHGYREDFYALAAKSGVPLVATNHLWKKANFKLKLYALLDSFALSRFDAIAAVSEPILHEMRRLPFLSKKNMRVIPNGVDVELYKSKERDNIRKECGLDPDTIAIGTVSSLSAVKGHRFLIEALADEELRDKNWRLIIVGSGPLEEELSTLCRTTGIDDKVQFLGAREDIPAVLSALDVFALPSLKEGLPMALLEAMASGKACIASSVGEIPTVLRNPNAGIMVPPESSLALTEAVRLLIDTPARREVLGKTAKELVRKEYSARRMAERYAEMYTEVLSR